ncbi:MAG: hypothetical protein LBL99_00780 [Holosporaceae bacterium]|jgi:hypothetical protein|nr:hypothetical protein [Holosporaceae bacterium]
MKIGKITRCLVLALAAMAVGQEASATDPTTTLSVPLTIREGKRAYVVEDTRLGLHADLTLYATTIATEDSAWIGANPAEDPWTGDAVKGGEIRMEPVGPQLPAGRIIAHGRFIKSGAEYSPYIPGIAREIKDGETKTAGITLSCKDGDSIVGWTENGWTSSIDSGAANGNGTVIYDFVADSSKTGADLQKYGLLADDTGSTSTIYVRLEIDQNQRMGTNALFHNSEIVLPGGSELAQNFHCRARVPTIGEDGRGAFATQDELKTALDALLTTLFTQCGTIDGKASLQDFDGATYVDKLPVFYGHLHHLDEAAATQPTDETLVDRIFNAGDAYLKAATTTPIRARADLSDNKTLTLSGYWHEFIGSHFLAEGDGTGTLTIAKPDSLPKSHITIGKGSAGIGNLHLTKNTTDGQENKYVTGPNTVLDLRHCVNIEGTGGGENSAASLELGDHAMIIF